MCIGMNETQLQHNVASMSNSARSFSMMHIIHLSDLADVSAISPQHSSNLSSNNGKLNPAGPIRFCDHRAYPRDALAIS